MVVSFVTLSLLILLLLEGNHDPLLRGGDEGGGGAAFFLGVGVSTSSSSLLEIVLETAWLRVAGIQTYLKHSFAMFF